MVLMAAEPEQSSTDDTETVTGTTEETTEETTDTQTDADTVKLMNEFFWDDYDPESDGIYSALSQVRTVLNNNVKYVEKSDGSTGKL